jgi:hypothetical protein
MGLLPRKSIYLVPSLIQAHPSVEVDAFAKHMREIHDDVQ